MNGDVSAFDVYGNPRSIFGGGLVGDESAIINASGEPNEEAVKHIPRVWVAMILLLVLVRVIYEASPKA